MRVNQLLYLDKGISAVGGLFGAEGFVHALLYGRDGATGQTGGQQGFPDLQKNSREVLFIYEDALNNRKDHPGE